MHVQTSMCTYVCVCVEGVCLSICKHVCISVYVQMYLLIHNTCVGCVCMYMCGRVNISQDKGKIVTKHTMSGKAPLLNNVGTRWR